jgi:hypothetical protein
MSRFAATLLCSIIPHAFQDETLKITQSRADINEFVSPLQSLAAQAGHRFP